MRVLKTERGSPAERRVGHTAWTLAAGCLVLLIPLCLSCGGQAPEGARASSPSPEGAAQVPAEAPGSRGEEARSEGQGVSVTAEFQTVVLSPAARVQAEKFMCACGSGHVLAECNCTMTPGSVDMKQYLQELVDQGFSPSEIEARMAERYGPGIIR